MVPLTLTQICVNVGSSEKFFRLCIVIAKLPRPANDLFVMNSFFQGTMDEWPLFPRTYIKNPPSFWPAGIRIYIFGQLLLLNPRDMNGTGKQRLTPW